MNTNPNNPGTSINRFISLQLVFVLVVALGAMPSSLTAAQQPNLILIYCDDLGYGDTGFTGHPIIKTQPG